MKKIVLENKEIIVGTGEELKPVAKSIWKHCWTLYSDCPKFTPYKVYGIELEEKTVIPSDVLLAMMFDLKL